jgi:hypothetical protein
VHQTGCWDLAPWYAALISRLDALEKSLGAIDALVAENAKLAERLAAFEAKPKRGRPAIQAASEASSRREAEGSEVGDAEEPESEELELAVR